MADFVFTRGIFEIESGATPLGTADLRVLLLNAAAAPTKDHNTVSQLVANEISVVGYARQTLANKTLVEDDANDRVYLDADDVTFAALAAGQTIGWAILFRHTGNDATAPVIAAYDLADTPTNGGNVVIQWASVAAGGLLVAA